MLSKQLYGLLLLLERIQSRRGFRPIELDMGLG